MTRIHSDWLSACNMTHTLEDFPSGISKVLVENEEKERITS